MTKIDQRKSDITQRNNVKIVGSGPKTLMLAHGFGCDQQMWRYLTPLLHTQYTLILFDYVGSGNSDFSAFSKPRYSCLEGYAKDVEEISEALELTDITFVGHSVSSVIGMIAAQNSPHRFANLVMICPSPCFLNLLPEYRGGFEKEDLEELINLMDKNYIGWANYLAPLVMGQQNDSSLLDELESSFCSTDPAYAKPFAKATFFSDYRDQLETIKHPTLILQSSDDALASVEIGQFIKNKITRSTLSIIEAHGHCLHVTNPKTVATQISEFL